MSTRRVSILRAACTAAIGLSVCVFTGGCMTVQGFERGTVVPVADLAAHQDDPSVIAVQRLRSGDARLAFHALELARTMRFAGEQMTRQARKQLATVGLDLAGVVEIAPAGEGPGCNDGADCVRAGPTIRVRGGPDGLVAKRVRADRKLREQAAKRQFWKDYKLIERRFAAYEKAEYGRTYASIFHGRFVVPSSENAQLSLSPEQAYVSYVVRDAVWALVVTRKTTVAVKLAISPADLDSMVRKLRIALLCPTYSRGKRLRRCGRAWQTRWQAPASKLHAQVWAPIAKHLTAARSVFVATDGPLVHVPFGVLRDDKGQILLAAARLTYIPSLAVYLSALNRKRKRLAPPTMLAIGDPQHDVALAAGTSRLPMAALEAAAVGGIFDGSTLLTDSRAREGLVKRTIASHNVLHFATHGLANSDDPLLSALLLSSGDGDGLLTADEIRWFDLNHLHVAVLSACETAIGASDQGGDAVLSSVVGSFLVAGAPAVVGSFWQVSDASTTLLMLKFYAAFLEVGVSEAMRQAQLSMAQHPKFAHPYFWAAFSPWGIDS